MLSATPVGDVTVPESGGGNRVPRMFVPRAAQRMPVVTRRSASGLVLPGVDDAARRLGLTPVLGESVFVERLTRVYLIAREYLEGFETRRGRKYKRDQWIAVLLSAHPAEEYLCQLAALNHAANSDELTLAYRDRFLGALADDAAEAARSAMAGGVDGRPRWLLARQMILRAMRMVLVPPPPTATPDPGLVAHLEGIDPETAAIVLLHLAAGDHKQDRGEGEPQLAGMPESLTMEIIANNVFNDRDDDGDMLGRYRLLWKDIGGSLTQVTPRRPPVDLLEEATGIDLEDLTALAYGYWAHARMCGLDTPIKLQATLMPGIRVAEATIERFLGLFALTPAELAQELQDRPGSWQMLPLQARPLLRLGNDVVVLDERYLMERVTRGLSWLVHDHERDTYGDQARNLWTKVYGEMVERFAEGQLRSMAPVLLGGSPAFFTEEQLQAAFPGQRSCDAVIDFGGDVVLAEIVSGTVTVKTREGDAQAFRNDAKRLVLDKARQVYTTARNLLRNPQPTKSPLAGPAGRIFPVVVCGGQFPINPLTMRYINEELKAKGLVPEGPIEPLALMDLEELEGCAALRERRGLTLPQQLRAWRASAYAAAAFRNYLAYEYGGRELGRPGTVGNALAESTLAIQRRLGVEEPIDLRRARIGKVDQKAARVSGASRRPSSALGSRSDID